MNGVSSKKIRDMLEDVRRSVSGPQHSWNALIAVLKIALCEHQWENKLSNRFPHSPGHCIQFCKRCGVEADEEFPIA